ncbi:MAG: PqiC family protein [Syntrophobacter sp.]
MRSSNIIRSALILACICLVVQSCASTKPSRFYILSSSSISTPGEMTPGASDISLGVGPIKLPEYLNRSQIVTRTSSETVQLAEFDRWAEPLDKNFARVLAVDLGYLLRTAKVSLFPTSGFRNLDYQVVVEVIQFDGARGGKASLSVRYTLFGKDGKEPLVVKKVDFTETVKGDTFEALVAAHCRNVGALSREIASAVRSLN